MFILSHIYGLIEGTKARSDPLFQTVDLNTYYRPYINGYIPPFKILTPSLINILQFTQVPPGIYDDKHGSRLSSMNKKSIYISERSPPEVKKAYLEQFQQDFSLFLESRSPELITGGRMVLILLGRIASDHAHCANSCFWELFYQSLAYLVAQVYIN